MRIYSLKICNRYNAQGWNWECRINQFVEKGKAKVLSRYETFYKDLATFNTEATSTMTICTCHLESSNYIYNLEFSKKKCCDYLTLVGGKNKLIPVHSNVKANDEKLNIFVCIHSVAKNIQK